MGRFKLVLSEVESATQPELQAVNAFALYLTAKSDADLEEAVERVRVMASEGSANSIIAILAATVFFREGMFDDALKVLSGHSRNMEWCVFAQLEKLCQRKSDTERHYSSVALMIQILLKMDRPDVARQQLAGLKSWAEDASIAQLAEAWVNIYMVNVDRISFLGDRL